MNNQTWLDGNARYLSLSLAWLRLKLELFSAPRQSLGSVPPDKPAANTGPSWQDLSTQSNPDQSPASTNSDADQNLDTKSEQLIQVQIDRTEAARMNPPPALIMLAQRFGMTTFEQDVLLLCTALELDTRIAGLCGRAQSDPNRPYPTFALALALFDDPVWEALSPERPLRYWRMLEINQPGAQPLTASALRADERIVNFVKGLNTFDDRLANFLTPLNNALDQLAHLPPSQEAAVNQIIDRWQRASGEERLPIVGLLGPDPISKQQIVECVAETIGLQVYYLAAGTLPSHFSDLETLARLWQRESMLQPQALYLDAQELDGGTPEQLVYTRRFLERTDGVIFLGTRENLTQLKRAYFSLDVDKPTANEQQALWKSALQGRANGTARQLAAQFNLNATTIIQIAQEASQDEELTGERLAQKLWSACSAFTRPRLDTLAQRIDAKATWEHLVLPSEQADLLHQIAHQVGERQTVYQDWGFAEQMNRGLGINALFAGESGTGKTMAAEVIANELRLNLYRIDLSAVVSKYIGETEKNLRRLFDAAEDGGAILFFDEADAMFGKRSEVKDSHDRYANIEVNYLLQRMEAYRGLAILATNMKSALDLAFVRRLRFIVNFPFPGPDERKLIWQKVFPARVPLDKLDYDRLARFNLTGGNIHSIALNAAFIAARAGTKVSMPIVLSAVRTEYRKLDRLINESELSGGL